MGFVSQLRLLLWKNLLLQKKKWKVGIFEILLPVLFAVLILVTRKFTKPTQHTNATIYEDDVFNTRRLVNGSLLFSLGLLPKQGVRALQLGYVPNSTVTSRVMQAVVQGLLEEAMKAMMPDLANTNLWYIHATNQTIEAILKQKVVAKPFSTEAAMQDYYVIHSWDMPFGVVFNGLTDHNNSLPATVNINIRPRTADTQTWHTAGTFPFMQDGGPRTGGDPALPTAETTDTHCQ